MPENQDNQQNDLKTEDQVYSDTSQLGTAEDPLQGSPVLTEMLENMPSYMARGIVYLLLFIIIAGVIYAYFGRMDVVVQARGKLIPMGDAAIVQSIKGGILKTILVKEGSVVAKGDTLAELDVTKAGIDSEKRTREYKLKERQMSCLRYAINYMGQVISGNNVILDEHKVMKLCSDEYVGAIVGVSNARMAYDKAMMQAQKIYPPSLNTFKSSITTKTLNLRDKKRQSKSAEEELTRARSRIDLYEELYKEELVSKVKLLEEQKTYQEAVKQAGEAQMAVITAENELEDARVKLNMTSLQYETAAQQSREKFRLSLIKFKAMVKNMGIKLDSLTADIANFKLDSRFQDYTRKFDRITAPVSGTVTFVKLRTPGELIKSGDTVFMINPSNQPLVAKILIPNRHVGRIKPGLQSKLKVDAFPYQSYGVLTGRVIKISPDSKRVGKELFFEATVSLDKTYLKKKGEEYKLFTGLTLRSEIVVERKRIVDNFLDPIKKLKG